MALGIEFIVTGIKALPRAAELVRRQQAGSLKLHACAIISKILISQRAELAVGITFAISLLISYFSLRYETFLLTFSRLPIL
ncbi:hypothetical protein MJ699_18445 [Klebsiella pneumoniae]|nr:hypothetical protein MJ699_18445 [Klebsiella pneumoniae]